MSACRWCSQNHGDARVRHTACKVCGDTWSEEVRQGPPHRLCRKPLCVAVDRWSRHYGRWPPRVWFERYAKRKKLIEPQPIKLPEHVEKIASGPATQRDLFRRGAA